MTLANANSKSIVSVSTQTQSKQCDESNSNKNISSTYTSSSTTRWKLSEVNFLNKKALDSHLDNLKISGDSMQDVTLLNSEISLLNCIVTNGLVDLPIFNEIDENFSYKHFFVPQNSESEYSTYKNNYDYFSMLVAPRLKMDHATNLSAYLK